MNLNERLVAIESKSLADSDRVGRLEAVVGSGDGLRVSDEFRRLFKANEAMDPAHSRIEFKGFSEKDSAHDRVCKIETAVIKILNGITYHVSHIPTGPRGKCTLGNSYLQFVSEFDREAAFAKLTGKVSFKNSKGEIVKFERARTKTQKTRNYYLFSAFDKAKEAFGETDVVINTKLPIRSITFKDVAIFEQSEYQLVGNFLGPASEWKFEDFTGNKVSKESAGKSKKRGGL